MPILLRMFFKDIFKNKKNSLFLIFILSLGLTGPAMVSALKSLLSQQLESSSKSILGADLTVYVRRGFTETEVNSIRETIKKHDPGAKETHMTTFYSMLNTPEGKSRLVHVRAIDQKFPFYGEIQLTEQNKDLHSKPSIWLYPELQDQLVVTFGKSLKLGDKELEVTNVIDKDLGLDIQSSALAPRVYISMNYLNETNLIRAGSTYYDRYLYKLADGVNAQQIKNDLFNVLPDPGIRVKDHLRSSSDQNRMLIYVLDYLGLSSLIALWLATLGLCFFYFSTLKKNQKSLAILKIMGFNSIQLFIYYMGQVLFYGLTACGIGMLISWSFFLFVQDFVPIPLDYLFSWQIFTQTGISTTITALIVSTSFTLPFIWYTTHISPNGLLQQVEHKFPKTKLLNYIPMGAVLFMCNYAVAWWNCRSWLITNLFVFSLVAGTIILAGLYYLMLHFLKRKSFNSIYLTLGLRPLYRYRWTTIITAIIIGLTSLLINLIPQLHYSITEDLNYSHTQQLPSLFLFDIQEDQKDIIEEELVKKGTKFTQVSPLIRSRLSQVNGEPYKGQKSEEGLTSREAQRERFFRNRGINLSFRGQLDPSETIVDGEFNANQKKGSEIPDISIEKRYLSRMGLSLGDKLTFDVLGVDITGQITSVRAIKWTSFKPNFFVQFNEGVLEDAPKTFVASVAQVSDDVKSSLQQSIVDKLPNISIIDVSRTITSIMNLISNILISLAIMAIATIISGATVVLGIGQYQMILRQKTYGFFKLIGISGKRLKNMLHYEYIALGASSAIIGGFIGVIIGFFIGKIGFQSYAGIYWPPLVISTIGICAIMIVISIINGKRMNRISPIHLLQ